MNKIVVDNFNLNAKFIDLDYFFTYNKYFFETINNILFQTSKLDKYNILFDLNEWYISEDNYYVSLVDYINSCKLRSKYIYFERLRLAMLEKQLKKIKKEIENIISKKVS